MSLALLGLVLVFLLNLFPTSMSTVRISEQRFRAGTLASNALEQQTALAFGPLPASGTYLPAQTIDQVHYELYLEILPCGAEDPQYLRILRCTVTWSFRGQKRSVVREVWQHQMPGS